MPSDCTHAPCRGGETVIYSKQLFMYTFWYNIVHTCRYNDSCVCSLLMLTLAVLSYNSNVLFRKRMKKEDIIYSYQCGQVENKSKVLLIIVLSMLSLPFFFLSFLQHIIMQNNGNYYIRNIICKKFFPKNAGKNVNISISLQRYITALVRVQISQLWRYKVKISNLVNAVALWVSSQLVIAIALWSAFYPRVLISYYRISATLISYKCCLCSRDCWETAWYYTDGNCRL